MKVRWALGALLLSGCLAPLPEVAPGARPTTVILYRNAVTVQMDDASLCIAQRPKGRLQWSGTLTGCPHAIAYEATLPRLPVAPRSVLREGGSLFVVGGQGFGF